MTTTLGELYDVPTDDAFRNRVKQLIADTYPPGWREWRICSETPSLADVDRNRIRFALPTVKLIHAYAPGTRYVSERQFKRMKADLLAWRLGQAFLTRPSTFAIALRPAQADYDDFLLIIKSLRLQILSRERANEVLETQIPQEEQQSDNQVCSNDVLQSSSPKIHCDNISDQGRAGQGCQWVKRAGPGIKWGPCLYINIYLLADLSVVGGDHRDPPPSD